MDGRHRLAVDDDRSAAGEAGIRGTPSFTSNGYFISGAQPLEVFARTIDLALKERAASAHSR
jgi:predicted DsbA family dithiol-disulfide isomerase